MKGPYLAQVESVIHLVLERTHLHLTDQLRLDLGVAKYRGKQFS